jgi:hypothetical protein
MLTPRVFLASTEYEKIDCGPFQIRFIAYFHIFRTSVRGKDILV